jgi:hypothetical protein
MRKIINGKSYDTETAKLIEEYSTSGLSRSDFRYYQESLYLKKTGEFFLDGEGHAMTKYRSQCGNSSSWGSAIIPLKLSEAKEWVENHCNERYEEIFGQCEE